MSNPKQYIGVEISWCNRFITIDRDIRKVDTKNPEDIMFEPGMVSFKFVDVIEYEDGRKEINRNAATEYFFGAFISLDTLKETNVNGCWDNAIFNIEQSDGIGMVISPDRFHSVMPPNGVLIKEQLIPSKKR